MRPSSASPLFALLVASSALRAQCGTEETFLPDPTSQPVDYFGTAVDLSGDVAVVGAIQSDGGYYGYYPGPGVVRVFRFDGIQWLHEQSFTNSSPIIGSLFGTAVATNGAWIVASAQYFHNQIWFFEWDGSSWVERQSFTGGEYYGYRMDVDGEWAAVVDPIAGAVDLYRLQSGQWSFSQKLTSGLGFINVAVDGTRLLVVEPAAPGLSQLSTYVFNGTLWTLEQTFGPSDPYAHGGALFGHSLSISADVLVVGMPWDPTGGTATGSAFIFRRVGGSWTLERQLREPGGPQAFHYFGFSVATNGERVVALTPAYYTKQGTAWTYRYEAGQWTLEIGLRNSKGNFDGFGEDVDLNGTTLLVGAPSAISSDGAAYFFPVTDLTLQVDPKLAPAGTLVSFDTCKGEPGTPAFLAAVTLNGNPVFLWLAQGTFDNAGKWYYSATVPGGLAGLVVTCASIGRAESGSVGFTNLQTIRLQ